MAGIVKNQGGLAFSGTNYKVVKEVLDSGEKIPLHNHKGEDVVISVLKGKLEIYLNDDETHTLVPGDIIGFDGKNLVKGTALEYTEFNETLIKK